MIVIRCYMHNALRNYNYLIACPVTREAIALDPYDADVLLALASEHNVRIKRIINTHEHHDHVEGNLALQQVTGATIWAHANALGKIPGQTHTLVAGDVVELGTLRLKVLFTPGHTPVHLCLLSENTVLDEDNAPALFSGDTLFNACAGNCKNGGNVDDMYQSFVSQLMPLPDATRLYPGHDYMRNNLGFALNREPNNAVAKTWLSNIDGLEADQMPIMTLGEERQYNPFLRLHEANIRAHLQTEFPALEFSDRAVFKALRQLRDSW